MKNLFKLLGIIAIVAVIGFSMIACGDDGGGGGTVTITGIPDSYNGKYALFEGSNMPGDLSDIYGFKSFNKETFEATLVQIAGGSVSLSMWAQGKNGNAVGYSGNDTVIGSIYIFDVATVDLSEIEDFPLPAKSWTSVTFKNGNAELTW